MNRPGVALAREAEAESYSRDCMVSRLRPVVDILLAGGDARITACCPRHAAGLVLAAPLRPAAEPDALDAAIWCVALWKLFGVMPRRREFAVRLVPADFRAFQRRDGDAARHLADFLPPPAPPDIRNALEALRTCARTDLFSPILQAML